MESNTLPEPKKFGGRKVGSRNKKTVFVEQLFRKNAADVKAIVETCIRLSKAGNPDFAKLVLDRIAPVRKGAILNFPLPPIKSLDDVLAAYDGLLQAVSQGLITSGEAVELSTVIDRLRQGLESSLIDERLKKLEDAEGKRVAP
jgi:hypothetical protein